MRREGTPENRLSDRGINRRELLKGAAGVVALAGTSRAQILSPGQNVPPLLVRSRIRLHEDWRFLLGDPDGAEQVDFDFSSAASIQLPHDWSIEGPFSQDAPAGARGGFMPTGVGWYRKGFVPPALTERQRLLIEFEGVYRYSRVWINGSFLGLRPSGFASFEYDLTPHLRPGIANILAVRVDNSVQPNLRWYSGSGIYRHVWLTVTDRLRIDWNGVSITTADLSPAQAAVRVVTTITNTDTTDAATRLTTQLFDPTGAVVGDLTDAMIVPAGSKVDVAQDIPVRLPSFWSIDTPNLYTAYSLVRQDGMRVDDRVTTFGIREAKFDKDRGFILNGLPVKLKGVSLHHDLGCLGAAVHPRSIERRLRAVRKLGCNAIRTSHNPPARELLDLCDRMGFVVIDEAFDKWFGDITDPSPDPRLSDVWQQDLKAFLLRDRNHPSVVLWSIGNEAGAPGSVEFEYWTQQLSDFVRTNEPSRPVTVVIAPPDGGPDVSVPAVTKTASKVDVIGLNYQEALYDKYRDAFATVPIIATEAFPFFRLGFDGFEPTNSWFDSVRHDYVAGHFVWNGVDHLGESTGWPSKGWPNGLFTSTAIAKPASAFFETVWGQQPTVRLMVLSDSLNVDPGYLPWRWPKSAFHWNFKGLQGQVFEVWTISNCETVELIQDGTSLGEFNPLAYRNWTIPWNIRYKPGKLEAIGRTGGEIVARDILETAGPPAKISIAADWDRIAADGLEVTHIDARLEDENGILVPDADMRITFVVQGPGRLLAVDNGELRSQEPYKANSRTTLHGRAMAVIQSTGEEGQILVLALADGLPPAAAGIAAIKA